MIGRPGTPSRSPRTRVLGGALVLAVVLSQLASGTIFVGKNTPPKSLSDGWWVLMLEALIGMIGISWGRLDTQSPSQP